MTFQSWGFVERFLRVDHSRQFCFKYSHEITLQSHSKSTRNSNLLTDSCSWSGASCPRVPGCRSGSGSRTSVSGSEFGARRPCRSCWESEGLEKYGKEIGKLSLRVIVRIGRLECLMLPLTAASVKTDHFMLPEEPWSNGRGVACRAWRPWSIPVLSKWSFSLECVRW